MEQDLNKYIVNEFCKLHSDVEQRNFIENFRFLMMSNEFDFENFYSNKVLRKTDFYSIADTLYQLNNLWMLSTFIHQNRHFLFSEVNNFTTENGKPDFTVPCKLGEDTMLSRVFKVMNNHTLNENLISEASPDYPINTHKLKIYSTTLRSNQPVPQIILQGKWIEKWGFSIGCNVRIDCYQNKLILMLDES